MIAIINGFSALPLGKIVRNLIDRLDNAREIPMTGLCPRCGDPGHPVSDHELTVMHRALRNHKTRGYTAFAGARPFFDPRDLKRVRMDFSLLDDEIYAFSLPVSATLLKRLTESPNSGWPGNTLAAYRRWADDLAHGARFGDMGFEIPVDTLDPDAIAESIRRDIHAPVEQAPARADWPALFAEERRAILSALSGIAVDVHHIGSTAVPGMPAKPIIDILVTVREWPDAIKCIHPLAALGYAFIDYPQNTDRLFFRKGRPRSHHIHIVQQDSASARDHLDFRDALLGDADLRAAYRHLKTDMRDRFKTRRARFGEAKGQLISEALIRYRSAGRAE